MQFFSLNKFDANRFGHIYVIGSFFKAAVFLPDGVDFYPVRITTGHQQESAVRGDADVPRVDARWRVGGLLQGPVPIDPEHSDTIILKPVAGKEETAVWRHADVSAAPCMDRVAIYYLLGNKDTF